MIDIKKLIENEEKFLKGFENKKYDLKEEVNVVKEKYNNYISVLQEEQTLRETLNKLTAEIKNDPSKIEEIKKEASAVSSQAKEKGNEATELLNEINTILSHFPNIALESVVVGNGEEDNKVISIHHEELNNKNENAVPHWEVLEDGRILTEETAYISGARHVSYKGKTAQIVRAIEQLMIDTHLGEGVSLVEPPVMVNKEAMFNTGQLPKFEEDLFKLDNGQYLIPTAEVPVTNMVAGKIISPEELPIRMTAATSCFRSEAGSAGRDTRGIIRLHQFRKVELVTIGKPGEDEKDFNTILGLATSILDKLNLPYRLVELCTGDTSFGSERTVDIEVYMPGVKAYREISSVSRFGTFQSRRMKTRTKNEDGKKEFVNTFNGSGLAIERTLAAIVENYVNENKEVVVPDALKKYVDFDTF